MARKTRPTSIRVIQVYLRDLLLYELGTDDDPDNDPDPKIVGALATALFASTIMAESEKQTTLLRGIDAKLTRLLTKDC